MPRSYEICLLLSWFYASYWIIGYIWASIRIAGRLKKIPDQESKWHLIFCIIMLIMGILVISGLFDSLKQTNLWNPFLYLSAALCLFPVTVLIGNIRFKMRNFLLVSYIVGGLIISVLLYAGSLIGTIE